MPARVPIGDYGLIGDTRSAALVAPDGSIDWWCVPRFDDPPLFGRLVGGPAAGWFGLGPSEAAPIAGRTYRPDTVTLTTTWNVGGGELELADGLVAEVEGRFLPGTVLVRRLCARKRSVQARLHFVPRFGYGREAARHITHRAGAVVCEHGDLAVAATWDGPSIEVDRPVDFEVHPSEPVTIVVTVAHRRPLIVVPPAVAVAELARDESAGAAGPAGSGSRTIGTRWCAASSRSSFSLTRHPAHRSPPQPPRCPSALVVTATGTTATPGRATRRSARRARASREPTAEVCTPQSEYCSSRF